MQKKRLSIVLITLLILSLLAPVASFADASAFEKQFNYRLGNVEYQYNMDALAQKNFTRQTSSSNPDRVNDPSAGNLQELSIESTDSTAFSTSSSKKFTTPQNFVPVSDSKEMISVIVELQEEPIAVFEAKVKQGLMKANVNQQSIIANEHSSFKTAMKKGFNVNIFQEYTHVFNGFALEIAADKVSQLLNIPGVKAVYPNNEVQATPVDILNARVGLTMDASAPHIGADVLWAEGFTGAGIKVGVLDTGIDYHHPDLEHAYKGGYDFVDNDEDPYETTPEDFENAPPGTPPVNERGSTYWTDHGSHVAGTIAGRGVADGGITGVAPGADIYAYRVLGPYGSGSNAGVIAGIERSVVDGMDVINLSLGSSSNNQYSPDSIALNNAMLAGVVVAVSAGNSGPGAGTTTDPASSEMAITVGNSYPPINVPSIQVDGLGTFTGDLMEYSPALGELEGQTFEVVYAGLGSEDDFAELDVAGKVALMKRGEFAFGLKSANAKAAGAVAAIIFNNAPGNFSGTLGEAGDHIPTFSLSLEDGQQLQNKYESTGEFPGTILYVLEEDYMNDGSSRGPARPGYDLKPDVAAPGTEIRSTIPAYGKTDPEADYSDAYAPFTGTSMAAPHVAGAAALLLDMHEGMNPFEVKSLLMNNAHKINDRDGYRYSHMAQGAGRIDLANSMEAKAVALVHETTDAVGGGQDTDYFTGSLSFGFVPAGSTVSRTITVKDIVGESSSYEIDTLWYLSSPGTTSTSVDAIEVGANGSAEFTVTISLTQNAEEDVLYEGEVILSEASGHTLQLPITLYVGEPEELDVVTDLMLDPDVFSPNDDLVLDTTDITFDLNVPTNYLSLDVHLWDGSWEGIVVEAANGLGPGSYIVRGWDGVYDLWGYGIPWLAWDDIYLMLPWYESLDGEFNYVANAVAPFIVDTEAPETSLDSPEIVVDPVTRTGTISGTIDSDLLIDLIDADILLNPMSQLFGAGVMYQNSQGAWVQVDGVVNNDGSFEIEVPLAIGDNSFEVYVYDLGGNGILDPAHFVDVFLERTVNVSAVASQVELYPDEAFTVDISFTEAEDLYAAEFSLTYDASLLKGTVETSSELSAYQASNSANSMIVNETVVELGNGKVRSDYFLTLLGDFEGYDGEGALATFNFTSDSIGVFDFELSNVLLLDSDGADIKLGAVSPGSITVKANPSTPDPGDAFVVQGSISAEAFGDGMDYSELFYQGDDGVRRVIVEALDSSGAIVKQGAVNADGTYRISLPEGEYTIRVVVPGHLDGEATVSSQNNELDFGPLLAGDANGDGVIDLRDLQQAAKAFGKTSDQFNFASSGADFNRDGEVDMLDISFILNNYGEQK